MSGFQEDVAEWDATMNGKQAPVDAPAYAPMWPSWADKWAMEQGMEPPCQILVDMLKQPVCCNGNHSPKRGECLMDSIQGATYLNISKIIQALDERLGHRWDYLVTQASMTPDPRAPWYVVTGRLTLSGADGTVSRDGGGSELLMDHMPFDKNGGKGKPNWQTKAFGAPFENAEASAMRRAAMKFGFCRELWLQPKKGGWR